MQSVPGEFLPPRETSKQAAARWAHGVAKPFEDRTENAREYENYEEWCFDENKRATYFKDICEKYFSRRYICFLDVEFCPGLDYMLQKDEQGRPRYEKEEFGKDCVSQTSAPYYNQLYYACARLLYDNGDVKDIWFPWYLFQTKYTHGYVSRNSPSEKNILNCLHDVFQHMLRNENAMKILSYGEVDIRVPVRFFDAVRRANTDLFHNAVTYATPRDRIASPVESEAIAWNTLLDLGWRGQARAQDIRDKRLESPHPSIFLDGQVKYLDMKRLNSNKSLEHACRLELGQAGIKGRIPKNFFRIFFRLATMTWKRKEIMYAHADPGLRNSVDIVMARAFGESLSKYCGRDVHWIYELALNAQEKYFGRALSISGFPLPQSRPTHIPTEVLVFDRMREESAAQEDKLRREIEANCVSAASGEPSQSQPQDDEMMDEGPPSYTDDSWSGDEARGAGVVHFRGHARATNPYLIAEE